VVVIVAVVVRVDVSDVVVAVNVGVVEQRERGGCGGRWSVHQKAAANQLSRGKHSVWARNSAWGSLSLCH
jgi:hypothetical protein